MRWVSIFDNATRVAPNVLLRRVVLTLMSTNLTKLPPDPIRETGAPASLVWHQERRRRVRVQVHWPVYFWGGRFSEVIESVTQDLSCDGFYCLSKVPFIPGETLNCHIKMPPHQRSGQEPPRVLDCRIRVVRIEPRSSEGYFGVGCRMEEYRLVYASDTVAASDPLQSARLGS